MEHKILAHVIILMSLLILYQSFMTLRDEKIDMKNEERNSPSKRLLPYLRFQKGMAYKTHGFLKRERESFIS